MPIFAVAEAARRRRPVADWRVAGWNKSRVALLRVQKPKDSEPPRALATASGCGPFFFLDRLKSYCTRKFFIAFRDPI